MKLPHKDGYCAIFREPNGQLVWATNAGEATVVPGPPAENVEEVFAEMRRAYFALRHDTPEIPEPTLIAVRFGDGREGYAAIVMDESEITEWPGLYTLS